MPQLDLNAYITNFTWFVLVFFVFYVVVVKLYIPRILKIFFYRYATIQLFLFKSRRHRLRLDYYASFYQFLESVTNYSLVNIILQKFKQSLDYQNKIIFLALFELINMENHFEQSFELFEPETFELNSNLFF